MLRNWFIASFPFFAYILTGDFTLCQLKYNAKEKLRFRSKIWIEDETGKVIFGQGRLKILEAVIRHGSIHAAAKSLK